MIRGLARHAEPDYRLLARQNSLSRWISGLLSVVSDLASAAERESATGDRPLRLFNHFLKLTPKHSSVVAIKRDMKPVPFFARNDEFVALIYLGWNKPFKEHAARARATITSTSGGVGSTLQKHKSMQGY